LKAPAGFEALPLAWERPWQGTILQGKAPMSIIRQDPTTKAWVIIATDRAIRPHDFQRVSAPRVFVPYDQACPFCPGNEAHTPQEVLRLPGDQGTGWSVRVIPNKFAVLASQGEPWRPDNGPLFREMHGVGYHEVIVETPIHDRRPSQLDDTQVEQVLRAYQARYQALQRDPRVRYIILFKNHGERAGTSLAHPHAQLVAMPIAPLHIRRKYEVAISHYDDTGRCLYCDLVEAEAAAQVRIVEETAHFVVFHPFASSVPFETWIAPKHQQSSFGQVPSAELAALAQVLRKTLLGLDEALANPDFNYILHSASTEDEAKPYYLWHIQILPRVTTIAGFELGSGMSITTVMPEESAASMRDIMTRIPSGRP
jgi:UDPglucose--hexose-1-phosphate uridylyltransferase